MKHISQRAVFASAAFALAAAAFVGVRGLDFDGAAPVHAQSACSVGHSGLDGDEQQFLGLLNAHRQAIGLGPLATNSALNATAAWKSEDQATASSFSHTDSLGRGPTARANDCGYPGGIGENIAGGFDSAQTVFDGWMRSPGHKANIENRDYGTVGIGRFGSQWTTTFGLGGAPAPKPAPPPPPAPAPKVVAPAAPPAEEPVASAAAAVSGAQEPLPEPEPVAPEVAAKPVVSGMPLMPRLIIALPGSVNARARLPMVSFGQ